MDGDYKEKYLKYKNKYNSLKNIQDGGLEVGELRAYFLTQKNLEYCVEDQKKKDDQILKKKYIEDYNKEINIYSKNNSCNKITITLEDEYMKENKVEQQSIQSSEHKSEDKLEPIESSKLPGFDTIRKWKEYRNIRKAAQKESFENVLCNKLIIKNNNLMRGYNQLQDTMFDGHNMRCNLHLYGMNLYEKSLLFKFKLDKIAPYCIQNKNFLYYTTQINNRNVLQKKNLHDNFDYTISDTVIKYINEIKENKEIKEKEIKYIVIVRSYRKSLTSDILISLYKIDNQNNINVLNSNSKWDYFKKNLDLQKHAQAQSPTQEHAQAQSPTH